MTVGFLLEADVTVCLHAVAVLEEQDEPLQPIPDKEWQVEKFSLLCRVNEFVVEFCLVEWADRQDETKQANSQEVFSQQLSFDDVNVRLFCFHQPFDERGVNRRDRLLLFLSQFLISFSCAKLRRSTLKAKYLL